MTTQVLTKEDAVALRNGILEILDSKLKDALDRTGALEARIAELERRAEPRIK